jgi:osmotically-inducible protein OsmY
MFNFRKKADTQLRQDVESELGWDPSVTFDKIAVAAQDGIVTLRGSVPHYYDKMSAEKAVRRVGGVRAIADELEVDLFPEYRRSDDEIARAALSALEWSYSAPEGIKVTVDNGWITLLGEAEWAFERNAAREAVGSLLGVRGVSNNITIKSKVHAPDVKARIEEALKRSAETEGRNIQVSVSGDRVNLSGSVHSFAELEDARLAAWSAPGVLIVDDDLKIAA